ncbi:uncharacterized protein LOC115642288, partial [Gopherus evgoodei]|uniref:uncharacterized protein LOC115642288 n=1 Tax=Gopherus evgoodei TaxID=1825980 RepID=UPI0011CF2054
PTHLCPANAPISDSPIQKPLPSREPDREGDKSSFSSLQTGPALGTSKPSTCLGWRIFRASILAIFFFFCFGPQKPRAGPGSCSTTSCAWGALGLLQFTLSGNSAAPCGWARQAPSEGHSSSGPPHGAHGATCRCHGVATPQHHSQGWVKCPEPPKDCSRAARSSSRGALLCRARVPLSGTPLPLGLPRPSSSAPCRGGPPALPSCFLAGPGVGSPGWKELGLKVYLDPASAGPAGERTYGNSVTQTEGTIKVCEGKPVLLNCTYEMSGSPVPFWYVQYPHEAPHLLLAEYEATDEEERKRRRGFSAKLERNPTSFRLNKNSSEISDSALYFCALGCGTYNKYSWGNFAPLRTCRICVPQNSPPS